MQEWHLSPGLEGGQASLRQVTPSREICYSLIAALRTPPLVLPSQEPLLPWRPARIPCLSLCLSRPGLGRDQAAWAQHAAEAGVLPGHTDGRGGQKRVRAVELGLLMREGYGGVRVSRTQEHAQYKCWVVRHLTGVPNLESAAPRVPCREFGEFCELERGITFLLAFFFWSSV